MFDVGSFRTRTCGTIGRRSFLRLAGSVPLALGLPGARIAQAEVKRPRAKSVIFVFLWGAPSHLDTCDPKPDAPTEYRGPFRAIATKTPGLFFSELLPRIASRSDRFSIIRTHATTEPGHPDAGTAALTGFKEVPAPVQPNFGSIVAKHRGNRGSLPPFVSLARGVVMDGGRRIEGYGGGTLSPAFDPMLVGCSGEGEIDIPALRLLEGLNPLRIRDRAQLVDQIDAVPRSLERAGFDSWNRNFHSAYDLLLTPQARQAFDLTRESEQTRGRYGYTVFGQSSLLARRLVEAEVPYIQLNYSRHVEALNPGFEFGWDTHLYNFELLQDQHCPILDRAYSALLDDLYDRGLIDQTLVVMMGEFGRTPRISANAARDHWPPCYFSIWSGGGVQPGRVIGTSDRLGEYPRGTPIPPLMVGTTIAELAGLDTQARAEMNVLSGGQVIDGLL
ncbi:MAG: DUF1501 domain-containing protein [Planctomycetaceae bacterium]|nr:DUF1501 domain-containing protein [Planctomycetaceae bacterium]